MGWSGQVLSRTGVRKYDSNMRKQVGSGLLSYWFGFIGLQTYGVVGRVNRFRFIGLQTYGVYTFFLKSQILKLMFCLNALY